MSTITYCEYRPYGPDKLHLLEHVDKPNRTASDKVIVAWRDSSSGQTGNGEEVTLEEAIKALREVIAAGNTPQINYRIFDVDKFDFTLGYGD